MHPTVGIFHVYTPTLSSLIPHPPPIFLRGVRNEAMPSVAQCNAQKSPALGKCYVDLCTVYLLSSPLPHPISPQGLGFMYSTGIGLNSNQAKVRARPHAPCRHACIEPGSVVQYADSRQTHDGGAWSSVDHPASLASCSVYVYMYV